MGSETDPHTDTETDIDWDFGRAPHQVACLMTGQRLVASAAWLDSKRAQIAARSLAPLLRAILALVSLLIGTRG